MRLTNTWGTFTADEIEVARLRSVPLADDMRRAVTLAKVVLGGRVIHVGEPCARCAAETAAPAAAGATEAK